MYNRTLFLAVLLGSRHRRRRLIDDTKIVEIRPTNHFRCFPNDMLVNKERFVLLEYPQEQRFDNSKYDKVEVRYYARVCYRTWKAVKREISNHEFDQLLRKAYIA
jgi:hypothetical protein